MKVKASSVIAKIFEANHLKGLFQINKIRHKSENKILRIVCPIPLSNEKYMSIMNPILAQ